MFRSLPLALLLLLSGACAVSASDARRPNIILIFSDDYGIPGVGCYGGTYQTPNLDALASKGMRFTHCYSMPLCGPSRGVTMSGRYPFRTGVVSNAHGAAYRPSDSPSIAKMLKSAGYATAVSGKWRQLQYFSTPEDAHAWGFDEFLTWGAAAEGDKGDRYWNPDYNLNGEPVDGKGKFGPDLLHDFAVDFIRRHRDGPFFLYYPTPLVHSPLGATPDTETARKDKVGKKQVKKSGGNAYAANVAYLDKLVGKLIDELDELKIRDNTLVIFTGDNGSTGGSYVVDGKKIDGKKGSMLEGGANVPLIVSWPGTAPSGKVTDQLVDFSDFYATFADLVGARVEKGVTFDGHSFAAQIQGRTGPQRDSVFVQLGGKYYARSGDWKLDNKGQLFSMKNAPYEQILINKESEEVGAREARKQLQAAIDDVNPQVADTKAGKKKSKKAAKKS